MNERIQQMIYSLNEKAGVHWINEDKIKFAELIVAECMNVIYNIDDLGGYHFKAANAVKEHFGVEE